MEDVTLSDHVYRIGKLNAMDQFHVARYIGPVIGGIAPMLSVFEALNEDDPDILSKIKESLQNLQPFLEALAEMPEERFEALVKKCLKAVMREDGGRYHPVVLGNGQIMYNDIDFASMGKLIWYVIQENLLSFLQGLSSSSEPAVQELPQRVGRR